MSIEPWQIALNAETGSPVGGSTLGLSRKGLLHHVHHAATANGVNVTSALFDLWPKFVTRSALSKPDRSPAMLLVEEMLGDGWTVGLSGRATNGGTTVLLRPSDAAFLRRLASVHPPKS